MTGKVGFDDPLVPIVKPNHRLPVLDGLRAVSILLVLAGHMLPLGPKFLRLNETAATMGMSLFFALSGFLIASLLLHNSDIVEFAAKRLGRIVPLAYAYTFLVFVVLHWDPESFVWTTAFLVNYVPTHLINYNAHLWSLCVEVQFYAAIALIVLFGGASAIWIVWPACLAILALRVSQGAYIHIQTHLRVDEILAGACIATVYRASWEGRLFLPTATVLVAAIGWLVSASPYGGWLEYLRPYTTGLLVAAVLCHGNTLLARFLSSSSMRYVATISYALYVIHPLTIQGWFNEGGAIERYLLKRPISFALASIAAHLSTFYWERPCLNAVNKWIEQRRLRRLGTIEGNPKWYRRRARYFG